MSGTITAFECSPGGAIERGRRRLGTLFLTLAVAMLAATAWSWWSGRLLAGLLSLGVALVVWTAWSLTADLDEVRLEIASQGGPAGRLLRVRTRSRTVEIPLDGVAGRHLTSEETEHLTRLASLGGVTMATGGFDSHLLGEFELYATDLGRAVLVETGEDRLVLTPDDPQGFLAALDRSR